MLSFIPERVKIHNDVIFGNIETFMVYLESGQAMTDHVSLISKHEREFLEWIDFYNDWPTNPPVARCPVGAIPT